MCPLRRHISASSDHDLPARNLPLRAGESATLILDTNPGDRNEVSMRADFYDQDYFDGPGKSNYELYTAESSPFGLQADLIIRLMGSCGLSGRMLDVGCAKGFLVDALRQRGVEAFGVDWSEYAIASADPNVRPYLERASALELSYGDRHFDLAVSFDVLEHLDRPRARQALVECARVSRWQLHQANTGRLAEWRFDSDASHCLKYSLEQWQAICAELNLSRTVICEPDRRLPLLDFPDFPDEFAV
jgi:SAM-dependent methyltransferase